jgi:Flp pilus assembly pilin Flp
MRNRRGQTILEYTVIFIIILGVMIAMKDYVKRGVQGRWKSATDDFGDQYDPQSVNSNIMYATLVNSASSVQVFNGSCGPPLCTQPDEQGQWTSRSDQSNSVETKTGNSQIGD